MSLSLPLFLILSHEVNSSNAMKNYAVTGPQQWGYDYRVGVSETRVKIILF